MLFCCCCGLVFGCWLFFGLWCLVSGCLGVLFIVDICELDVGVMLLLIVVMVGIDLECCNLVFFVGG